MTGFFQVMLQHGVSRCMLIFVDVAQATRSPGIGRPQREPGGFGARKREMPGKEVVQ